MNTIEKLDEETKKKKIEVWCLSALSILEKDKDFQEYCEGRGIKTNA